MGLEYDNSAFYYFTLATLSVYLFPVTLYSINRIVSGLFFSSKKFDAIEGVKPRTEAERLKFEETKKQNTTWKSVFSTGFIINLVVLVIGIYTFYVVLSLVQEDKELAVYNPFSILGLENTADTRAIKRAYRQMSLKFHPDKNPDNLEAAENFMKVAKAYEALTDEVARSNWEKFGNPDGRQALQVSIGLPTFLLSEDNHGLVLGVYMLVLLLVIPAMVCWYYSRSQQYGDTMVKIDTYRVYNYMLSENSHISHLPEMLALSAEYTELPVRSQEAQVLDKLQKGMLADGIMKKARQPRMLERWPSCFKTWVLLHAYLCRRTEKFTPALWDDLRTVLKPSQRLVEGMLEVAFARGWLQTVSNIIDFQQMLTQALWLKESSLLQLPHFSLGEVKHASSGRNAVKTLAQYVRLPAEERKGMANFSQQQIEDVNAVCTIVPDMRVQVGVLVEDEDGIVEGDIITVKVVLTRRNLPFPEEGGLKTEEELVQRHGAEAVSVSEEDLEGDQPECGPVHSTHFPFVEREGWHLLLCTQTQKLVGQAKTMNPKRQSIQKLQFMAPPPGQYELELRVKCTGYLGCDVSRPVKFTVADRSTLPKIQIHPEDLELDNEPTLFQQMGGLADDTDSDFASSDDEGGAPSSSAAASAARRLLLQGEEEEEGGEDSDERSEFSARASEVMQELAQGVDGNVANVSVSSVMSLMESELGKLGRGEKRRLKKAIESTQSRLINRQRLKEARAQTDEDDADAGAASGSDLSD